MRRPAQYMAHSSCIWGIPGSITDVNMKFVSVVGYRGPPSFQKKEKEYRKKKKKTKVGMHHHDVYLRKIMYTYVCMYIVKPKHLKQCQLCNSHFRRYYPKLYYVNLMQLYDTNTKRYRGSIQNLTNQQSTQSEFEDQRGFKNLQIELGC